MDKNSNDLNIICVFFTEHILEIFLKFCFSTFYVGGFQINRVQLMFAKMGEQTQINTTQNRFYM